MTFFILDLKWDENLASDKPAVGSRLADHFLKKKITIRSSSLNVTFFFFLKQLLSLLIMFIKQRHTSSFPLRYHAVCRSELKQKACWIFTNHLCARQASRGGSTRLFYTKTQFLFVFDLEILKLLSVRFQSWLIWRHLWSRVVTAGVF